MKKLKDVSLYKNIGYYNQKVTEIIVDNWVLVRSEQRDWLFLTDKIKNSASKALFLLSNS